MSQLCRKYFFKDENVVRKVREAYGVSEEVIRTDIAMLREWLKKQPHLPGDDTDERLEGFLLRNKFNLEKTKRKIENYYTMRGLNADYFEHIDPLSKVMQDNRKCFNWVPIPSLTPKLERVFIYNSFGDDSLYHFGTMILYVLCIQDLKIPTDYCMGDRLILDFAGFGMARFKTMDINTYSKTYNLYQKAFSGRLLGIELMNAPPFKNLLLALMKAVMNKKIYEKITIHEDLDSLHNNVPKDCLPKEYGGNLGSIDDMHDEIGQMLLDERDNILRYAERVSDESRRIGDVPQNYQFGVEGSFKKLNLD